MKFNFRNIRWIAALGFAAALAGCNQTVKIVDGIIPPELLPFVQKFLGDYSGQLERQPMGLNLSLDGNRLVVTSTEDFIAPACKSKIGNLTELTYHEEKDKSITVTEAFLNFDANLCGNEVLGRNIKIKVSKNAPLTLDVDYLDHYNYGWRCDGFGSPMPYPQPTYPGQNCWHEQTAVYNTGRFAHL